MFPFDLMTEIVFKVNQVNKKISNLSSLCFLKDILLTDIMRLRQVGSGVFGSFMHNMMKECCSNSSFQSKIGSTVVKIAPEIVSRSMLSWDEGISQDESIGAVYIASPDHVHSEHAIQALNEKKHVLVEKPLYDFSKHFINPESSTLTCPLSSNKLHFQVAFHRRHDDQFQKAKSLVQEILSNRKKYDDLKCKDNIRLLDIHLESFDPVPRDDNLEGVVRNSMVHDFDCALWMMERNEENYGKSLDITSLTTDSRNSGISLCLENGDESIRVRIDYRKCDPTYTQQVTIKGFENHSETFGYCWTDSEREWPCEWKISGPKMAKCWDHAYRAQFLHFAKCCLQAEHNTDRKYWIYREQQQKTYKCAFTLMDKVAEKVANTLK